MGNSLKFTNGSAGAPLNLSPAQRHALLAKYGMQMGWLLLTRSEMQAMKQQMEACQAENDRLNLQATQLIAERLTPTETSEKLDRALAENNEWRKWCRFCLGLTAPATPTAQLREQVIAAWDKMVLAQAKAPTSDL